MAILTEGRLLITDASNVPLNGGKARIYNTGTTTLTSVFSDAGLTTPLTNPVVANSSGFTPVIYAAEATVVDVTYLTSADATVAGRTYTAVPFLGSDSGTFTRTLADNTRFKISGAGGTVSLEVGDPSPDNVGGAGRLGGWAGTQATSWEIDAAATDTTGVFTENSKKMLGIVNTAATTFTTVASVDIALTQNPSGVLAHEVDVIGLKASSSSTQLSVQFSYDGGATYKSGASDYSYYYEYKNLGSPSDVSYVADAAHTQIVIGTNVSIDAFRSWLKMHVLTVASGTEPTMFIADLKGYDSGGNPAAASAHGYGLGSYGKATHMRLLASTGTITGAYRVAPMRGFGE